MAACNITVIFTAVNEIDISAAESAAHPYFDVYVSPIPPLEIVKVTCSNCLLIKLSADRQRHSYKMQMDSSSVMHVLSACQALILIKL